MVVMLLPLSMTKSTRWVLPGSTAMKKVSLILLTPVNTRPATMIRAHSSTSRGRTTRHKALYQKKPYSRSRCSVFWV